MGDEMHYRTGGEWMRVTASIERIGMVHQALALLNSGLGQEQYLVNYERGLRRVINQCFHQVFAPYLLRLFPKGYKG